MSNSLLKQQSHSVITNLIGIALSAATIFGVAGILGPEKFGVVGILLMISAVAAALQHFGINAGMMKLVAASESEQYSIDTIRSALVVKLAILLLASLVLLLSIGNITSYLQRPYIYEYIPYVVLLLISSELSSFLESTVFALHKAHRALNTKVVIAIIRFLVIVLFTIRYSITGYLVGSILLYFLSAAIYAWQCRVFSKNIKFIIAKDQLIRIWNQGWGTAKVSYVSKLANTLWLKVPVLLCSVFFSDEETGILFFALQIGERLRSFGGNVSVVSFPYMSKLFSESQEKYKSVIKTNFTYLIFALAIAVLSIEFLFLPAISYFIGKSFSGAQVYLPFVLLAASAFIIVNWISNFILFPAEEFSGIIRFQIYNKLLFIVLMSASVILEKNILFMLAVQLVGDIVAMLYFYNKSYTIFNANWLKWSDMLVVSLLIVCMSVHGLILLQQV